MLQRRPAPNVKVNTGPRQRLDDCQATRDSLGRGSVALPSGLARAQSCEGKQGTATLFPAVLFAMRKVTMYSLQRRLLACKLVACVVVLLRKVLSAEGEGLVEQDIDVFGRGPPPGETRPSLLDYLIIPNLPLLMMDLRVANGRLMKGT